MAGFNEILVGRFNRGLQKLFGIKGGPPVPTLSSEIMPIHPLESGVENRYLEGWNRYGVVIIQGASVGNNSAVRFRNIIGNNVIAIFEQISLFESVTDTSQGPFITLGVTTLDLGIGNPVPNSRLDARTQQAPSLSISRANGAINIGQSIWQQPSTANIALNVIFDDNQEIPLLPGDGLQITTVSLNAVLGVSAMWRERFLEDSERA